MKKKGRIAVIGGGVAGMVAAHRLSEVFSVDLFEQADRLGGHIRPLAIASKSGLYTVDTAFLGYKPSVYPSLCKLLCELGVETQEKTITGGVCFAKHGLRFNRMHSENQSWPSGLQLGKRDQRAFLLLLAKALKSGCADLPNVSLQDYLLAQSFSHDMIRYVIAPDVASIWGIQPEDALGMSIQGAVGSLLTVGKGVHIFPKSTNLYLDELEKRLNNVQIFKNSDISEIETCAEGINFLNAGDLLSYDSVIFACSASAAYYMLSASTKSLFEPLNKINYVATVAIVHSDERVSKLFKDDFGHFNYLEEDFATVTWNITDLYGIASDRPVYLTAGPPALLDASARPFERVIDMNKYQHCVHTPVSIDASKTLRAMNGFKSVYFAGSYLGFAPIHEAAVVSAENVAATLLGSVKK